MCLGFVPGPQDGRARRKMGKEELLDTLPSVTRLGDLWPLGKILKPLATINLPKYHKFLGNFCNGVKIYHFSSEIILGQLL